MLFLAALLSGRAHAEPTPVTISVPGLGDLTGIETSAYRAFRGVPYAEAPIGDRRWRPPEAKAVPWNATVDATAFRHSCMQSDKFDPAMPDSAQSEDCLFLNVFTPAGPSRRSGDLLPVMVWIHGGGYTGGGGNESRLDGTWIVTERPDVIVVTLNYRLNVFGFLGSDALRGRDQGGGGSTGNYGLQDQRMALKWVNKWVAGFGGDKDRVFLVGESAGAASVSQHLVRERSWGLFSRAGMESGGFAAFASAQGFDMKTANAAYDALLNATGCARAECLVALPAEKVKAEYLKLGFEWGPVLDGVEQSQTTLELGLKGNLAPGVPIIGGSVRDDLGGGIKCTGKAAPLDCVRSDLYNSYKDYFFNSSDAERLVGVYSDELPPPINPGNATPWYWAGVHAGGDAVMGCPSRRAARFYYDRAPAAYLYQFAHVPTQYLPPPARGPPPKAHHACEIPYVFNVKKAEWGDTAYQINPDEYWLGSALVTYWANFATSGDPNKPVAPPVQWPAYTRDSNASLIFGQDKDDLSVTNNLKRTRCDFWDGARYKLI